MIKVDITNLKTNTVNWSGRFETQDLATAWVNQCVSSNVWGKPARTLQADQFGNVVDIDGTVADLSKAISTGVVTEGNRTFKTYTFASEYSVAQSDITAQVATETAFNTELESLEKGKKLFATIRPYSKVKNLNTTQQTTLIQVYRQIRDVLELQGATAAATYAAAVSASTAILPDAERAAIVAYLKTL